MNLQNLVKLLMIILTLFLLSGCLFQVPYSQSKNITIDKRLIGDWENKIKTSNGFYKVQIAKIDKYTYKIEFYQEAPFVGDPMIFHIKADGYLFKSKNFLLGQFKITELPGVDKDSEDYKIMIKSYIIGVFEEIKKDSFKFHLLAHGLLGLSPEVDAHITTDKLKNAVDRVIATEKFRTKKEYYFIRKI